MAKQDLKPSSLFFHMGPGFHGKIEAHAFAAQFPHVKFLHQPYGLSFKELIQWTVEAIEKEVHETQSPVTLLGHSFGGQLIAGALAQIPPQSVRSIALLNSAYDIFDCFANLEEVLLPKSARGTAAWKSQPLDSKLQLVFTLAQRSDFADAYWSNKEKKAYYFGIAAQYPPLNTDSFVQVASELFVKNSLIGTQWSGPIDIFYSLQDNLIRRYDVVAPWKEVYKAARFIEVQNIGHHGLFESEDLADRFFGA